jgi:xanthine/CO dehydrogenase XdhC/CoxF family maturation factor
MKEIREIVKAYGQCVLAGRKMALASVVYLEGSSYRRPGARMLVDDEGRLTGAISGGCLEGDALRKALLVISQQDPKLVTYDTTDEDDMTLGVQLGCAGVIQVLFEPVDPALDHNPVHLLQKALASRQPSVLVTLLNRANTSSAQMGTCLLLQQDGTMINSLHDNLTRVLSEDARLALATSTSLNREYLYEGQTLQAFIEYIPPPVSLIVVGGGNDAVPLVNIGSELGWDVSVVDGRPTHAQSGRFEAACQVLVSKPEAVLEHIAIDPQTVFVLMTHNYQYDLAMLRALLPLDLTYIGVLGPKKKLNRMIVELKDSGMHIDDGMMAKLYGPIGLDIGAETPEEIALSMVAEIKAVLSKKNGSSLRDKAGSIHTASIYEFKSGL